MSHKNNLLFGRSIFILKSLRQAQWNEKQLCRLSSTCLFVDVNKILLHDHKCKYVNDMVNRCQFFQLWPYKWRWRSCFRFLVKRLKTCSLVSCNTAKIGKAFFRFGVIFENCKSCSFDPYRWPRRVSSIWLQMLVFTCAIAFPAYFQNLFGWVYSEIFTNK